MRCDKTLEITTFLLGGQPWDGLNARNRHMHNVVTKSDTSQTVVIQYYLGVDETIEIECEVGMMT
jgi:hypothetical protein